MFQPSTLTASAARIDVAESAGAQANDIMQERAGTSLNAVAQRWNRLKWKFLYTEAYIAITAPFDVAHCSATAGSTTLETSAVGGFANVLVDDLAVADVIRAETLVSASATSIFIITLAAPASADGAGFTTTFRRPIYPLPSNLKSIYDIHTTGDIRPLFYIQRRTADRTIYDQIRTGQVVAYDLFLQGDRGKIRFLAPPATANTALVRYHRRITMPTSDLAAVLDVPQDYEDVFMAAAKAHFLADKKDASTRMAYWASYARDGLKEMRSDEAFLPDEILTFEPPTAGVYSTYNPDNTLWWDQFFY